MRQITARRLRKEALTQAGIISGNYQYLQKTRKGVVQARFGSVQSVLEGAKRFFRIITPRDDQGSLIHGTIFNHPRSQRAIYQTSKRRYWQTRRAHIQTRPVKPAFGYPEARGV
jgi:hypothetical protein